MAKTNATLALHELGQSLWLDNITRDLLGSGTLQRYIDDLSVTGLTSNPTIFDQALKGSAAYDDAIRDGVRAGRTGEALFFDLALDDLTRAADLFRPVHQRTNGVDGWVSLEVSPLLARDPASTLKAAKSLFARAERPNLHIKIPGTKEGLPAIEEATFAGIPVNVTLLFSREHYLAAADAWLRGVERRIVAGLDPDVRSVASIFVSRWDVAVATEGTTRPAKPAGQRHRRSGLLGGACTASIAALAARPECRRPTAARALGKHRDKGSRGLGPPLREGARRSLHREHHAREDPPRLRRPRRPREAARRGRPGCRGGDRAFRPCRRGRRRGGSATPGRGRQVLREVLERAARRASPRRPARPEQRREMGSSPPFPMADERPGAQCQAERLIRPRSRAWACRLVFANVLER